MAEAQGDGQDVGNNAIDYLGGIDSAILEEAKTKRSPAARLEFFTSVCGTIMDSLGPPVEDHEDDIPQQRFERNKRTIVSVKGLSAAYQTLFHKSLETDNPAVGEQFQLKENGLDSMSGIFRNLEMGADFASQEPDRELPPGD